jgi:hypothetical protein
VAEDTGFGMVVWLEVEVIDDLDLLDLVTAFWLGDLDGRRLGRTVSCVMSLMIWA